MNVADKLSSEFCLYCILYIALPWVLCNVWFRNIVGRHNGVVHIYAWFGLCCLMTSGFRKDIRCHVWPYFFLNLQTTRLDMRPHIKWAVSLMIAFGHFIYIHIRVGNIWGRTTYGSGQHMWVDNVWGWTTYGGEQHMWVDNVWGGQHMGVNNIWKWPTCGSGNIWGWATYGSGQHMGVDNIWRWTTYAGGQHMGVDNIWEWTTYEDGQHMLVDNIWEWIRPLYCKGPLCAFHKLAERWLGLY